jgi:hypothetical protein
MQYYLLNPAIAGFFFMINIIKKDIFMFNSNIFANPDNLVRKISNIFENQNLQRKKIQAEQAIEQIQQQVKNGGVFNQDFLTGKKIVNDYIALLRQDLFDKHYLSIPRDQRDQTGLTAKISDAYYHAPAVHNATKTIKLFNDVKKLIPQSSTDVDHLVEFVSRANQLFDQAKTIIIKGRKPSETPRQTPVRTIENTGTCGICGKNVKMKPSGGLFEHGFNLKFHFRSNVCYGSNRQAIEVSVQPVIDYIKSLEKAIESNNRKLLQKDLPDKRRHELTQETDYISKLIPVYQKIVRQWTPEALPGDLLKLKKSIDRVA